jgi:hypothetical protein
VCDALAQTRLSRKGSRDDVQKPIDLILRSITGDLRNMHRSGRFKPTSFFNHAFGHRAFTKFQIKGDVEWIR